MRPMPELEVVNIPTTELVEYRNNAKLHPIEQIDQIAQSIWEFGFNNPILAWHNDSGEPEIVAGHGRLMAARKLGLRELPVVFLDHMTEEQRRAYILVDNQLTMNSGFDEDTLQAELSKIFDIDMEQFDFDVTVPEDEEADLEPIDVDEDELPEASETRVKAGQIWQFGDHRLVCGDSTDPNVLHALMGEEKADPLLTDPPYGISYVGGTSEAMTIENDDLRGNELQDFIKDSMTTAKHTMRDGAAFYVWFATATTNEFYRALHEAGMQVRQQLYWVKGHFTLGRQDYQHQVEPCLYGWIGNDGHWFAPTRSESDVIDDMADYKKMDKSELVTIIERLINGDAETDAIRADKPLRNGEHPTMKPVALFARLIRNSTRRNEVVLDSFAGSGTTAIACEQMGRKARLVELSEGYCEFLLERWERFTGKKAELVGEA